MFCASWAFTCFLVCLWIFFSDAILLKFVSSLDQYTRFSLYKGWAFILTTSVLLFLLIRKTLQQQSNIENSLQVSEERWKFALEGAGDGVWDWNLQTNEVFRSARWKQIFGYLDNEIPATSDGGRNLIHTDDLPNALDDIEAYLANKTDIYVSEFRLLCKNGTYKWTLSRGILVSKTKNGKPLRMIGTHTDITARKESEAQVIRLAYFDQVTNLPNRLLFVDRFKQEIKIAQRNNQKIALIYLDLDHFKEVNDTLGHDMGDLLLKETAQRLATCLRAVDTLARLGGDEFTIIINTIELQCDVERIAKEILDALAKPFQIGNELIYITCSIGISFYPDDGNDVEALLKNADQAMYAAKEHGRNRYHFFTPVLQEVALNRKRLISDLRLAVADSQFKIFYQPIIELATNKIHKAEALIRWQHPSRGLVSPVEFIPIAEDTGLIVEIGDWVFTEAANQVAKWRLIDSTFQISINKSPIQFRSGSEKHIDWIKHLTELNLPGNSMTVEITEGLLLDARDPVTNQLNLLREAGFQIAIDDFGTGYSSLSYLRKFNIDYIKIDRSFISTIQTSSSDWTLCEAIIVMGHKLGMKLVAEGIETKEQLDLLLSAGCDYGQGYLFSKPIPAEAFEKLLITQD